MTPKTNLSSRLPRWAARLLIAGVPVLMIGGVAGAAVLAQDESGPDEGLVAAAGFDSRAESPPAATTTTAAPSPTTTVPVTTTEPPAPRRPSRRSPPSPPPPPP